MTPSIDHFDAPVLIAGAGIAGLTMALTLHQIGVSARVFESVREMRPLGVGINLQPNAVRELHDLGLSDELPQIGIESREWALVGRNGNDVWAEPRGRLAGYAWPQFAVHRGELQMMLYRHVVDRLGPDAVVTGARVVGYEHESANPDAGVTALIEQRNGGSTRVPGRLLIACDGLHSAVREQMHPQQGPPHWGGALMWRGTSYGAPIRSGSSFVLVGSLEQRFVHYPIGETDPDTGLQLQNWLCEMSVDPDRLGADSNWNKRVSIETFLPDFADWDFDWLDVPSLVRSAEAVYEFPMVDRDPADRWVDHCVALCGDAAHVMYPVGSNGASQAIVDTRVLGAEMIEHGTTTEALLGYEERLLDDVSALVLRNRAAGPIAILGEVDRRCGGVFDDIDEVMPRSEREEFMERYKAAAGFARDTLNAAPPTIAPGATVRS